jgi:hypothetical protein
VRPFAGTARPPVRGGGYYGVMSGGAPEQVLKGRAEGPCGRGSSGHGPPACKGGGYYGAARRSGFSGESGRLSAAGGLAVGAGKLYITECGGGGVIWRQPRAGGAGSDGKTKIRAGIVRPACFVSGGGV